MGINNPGGHVWKVNLSPSQKKHNLAVEIWISIYQVDYELLDTPEEQINFLKEILGKNRENGGISNKESKEALQGLIIKKLKYARDQQANASTVKGQEPQEPIQKNNCDSEPTSTQILHNEKINWQGKQTQLAYVWEKLFELGLIAQIDDNRWQILADHFICQGKPLKARNLRQSYQNLLNNPGGIPKGGEKLKDLIEQTEKTLHHKDQV
ncbi:MAG: hypothetical protein QF832_14670 [SAR324 cluster bacterium]|nr:hypothetical protein [SAR324 cluster bacterium]